MTTIDLKSVDYLHTSDVSDISDVSMLGDIGIDEGFWNTAFEDRVWKESRIMGQKLETYIEEVKDRRIPSENWLASLVYAFTKVAYESRKVYNKSEFLSFWKPAIIKANPMLANTPIVGVYPYKFDRAVGALRELHEQGKVPNIIWKPWTSSLDHDNPIGLMPRVWDYAKTPIGIMVGVGLFYLFLPRIVQAIRRPSGAK